MQLQLHFFPLDEVHSHFPAGLELKKVPELKLAEKCGMLIEYCRIYDKCNGGFIVIRKTIWFIVLTSDPLIELYKT